MIIFVIVPYTAGIGDSSVLRKLFPDIALQPRIYFVFLFALFLYIEVACGSGVARAVVVLFYFLVYL